MQYCNANSYAEDKGKRIIPICLHSKIDGIEKLQGLFNERILVYKDDLGFEHGMDNLVEILGDVEQNFFEESETYDV
ncbi:hypothetical protein Ae201684P_003627 [Aphanomyces euteiches]|nr:hypothetical protein Ae201684P_003627 [Aphanomyces euteiches]